MKKYLCRYGIIDYARNDDFKLIEEYKPMTEAEFFEFCKRFIRVGQQENYGFCNEQEIRECIKYINENGEEDFCLGHNPYNDIGFEELLVNFIYEE